MKTIKNTTSHTTSSSDKNTQTLEQTIAKQALEIEALQAKVTHYEELFRLNQHQKFAASSEQTNPEQLSFFNEAEKASAQKSEEPHTEVILRNRKNGRSKSRKTYDDLPVEEVHYTLSEDQMDCPNCEGTLHEMKTEIRRELKIIPAQVKVVHHIRQVYACRYCDKEGTEGTIVRAPMPKSLMPGSMVSPSLLAFIMERKYNQHLPLYRQEKVFENFGIDISRQNMAAWIMYGANNWLRPLYERMHVFLKNELVVHADESPLKVIDEKKNSKGYMWLYASAKSAMHPMFLYDYQSSRSQKNPQKFLEGFSGYLQTDGYSGYNAVENVTQVGCLAHARRKFNDALKALPEDAELSRTKSSEGLRFCNQIYHYEKQYMNLTPEERFKKRQEAVKPVLDAWRSWLEEQNRCTLPKSKLGEAVKYCLNQWDKLINFMLDGHIAVDNNLAERAIKPFVIGRKNYLFSRSPKGAQASAMSYSIIETAKANKLNPFFYLTYLFKQLPNIDIEDDKALDALLPWAKSIPDEIRNTADKQD